MILNVLMLVLAFPLLFLILKRKGVTIDSLKNRIFNN